MRSVGNQTQWKLLDWQQFIEQHIYLDQMNGVDLQTVSNSLYEFEKELLECEVDGFDDDITNILTLFKKHFIK